MSKSALLVIDVQKDVVAEALNTSAVVSNINSLVTKAREENVPVIWVQHSDEGLILNSPGWEIVDELQPVEGEPRIYKTAPSSFEGTDLGDVLSNQGITHVIMTGAQTDHCVNATSNNGVELGYTVTLVSDGHTTLDTTNQTAAEIIAAKNRSFAELGRVVKSSEITF